MGEMIWKIFKVILKFLIVTVIIGLILLIIRGLVKLWRGFRESL